MQLTPKRYEKHNSHFVKNENGSWTLVIEPQFENTIGFVAQEVYNIMPEVINKPIDDSKELWGMNEPRMIAALVNAIKELAAANGITLESLLKKAA